MYSSFQADFHISSKDKSKQDKVLNASHTLKHFIFPRALRMQKKTALLSVYKYLSGQQLKRAGQGLQKNMFCFQRKKAQQPKQPAYMECGKQMKQQFVYDPSNPKQNLLEFIFTFYTLHTSVMQMQQVESFLLGAQNSCCTLKSLRVHLMPTLDAILILLHF